MKNALEYLFYRDEFCQQFTDYLKQNNIPWELTREPIQDAFVVMVNEKSIAAVWDEVDEYYDQLAEQESVVMESDERDENISTAGIHIQLSSGQNTIAKVDPIVLKRILSVVDNQAFAQFIDTIVASVEQPDDSAICQNNYDSR